MDFESSSAPNICALIRGKAPTTSMSYHEDGVHLFVTSETDSRLRLIDTIRGTSDTTPIKLERDGIQLVRATHHNQCVLCTTSPQKTYGMGNNVNSIQYLSLYDNKILRQFSPRTGEEGRIHTLSMSPVDDLFLSSSSDRMMRLYDISMPKCIAELSLPSQGISTQYGLTDLDVMSSPCTAFDSSGLVFAASARVLSPSDHLIHLYDARKYDAPFSEFRISVSAVANALLTHHQATRLPSTSSSAYLSLQKAMEISSLAQWTNMTFSPSGKGIIVNCENGITIVLDSYEGNILHVFLSEGPSSTEFSLPSYPAVSCYTSDDQSILCGNENGTLSVWDVSTGKLRRKLEGHVGSRVSCIQSNPKFTQFASACTNIALWLW